MNTLQVIAITALLVGCLWVGTHLWTDVRSIIDCTKACYATARNVNPPTRAQLKHAIACVESGDNPAAIGRHGERTRYQIHPNTWRMYSRISIATANSAEIERVADAILDDIDVVLINRRLPIEPYAIALRWNAGHGATIFSTVNIDFANRVAALARDFACKT